MFRAFALGQSVAQDTQQGRPRKPAELEICSYERQQEQHPR